MAKFCTNCGKEIPDGIAFCTECGAKIAVEAQPKATPVKPTVQPKIQETVNPVQEEVIGTGYFFMMMLVYALPIVGWGLCLFNAFVGNNKTKKNFARAVLIWVIIGLVLGVACYFLIRTVADIAVEYFNTQFGSQFNEFKDILDQLKGFSSGDLSSLPFDLEGIDLSGLEDLPTN